MRAKGSRAFPGTADVSLTPDGPFRIALDGKDLELGSMGFDTLTLRGDGGMPSHRVSLALTGPQMSTRVEANGSLGAGGSYQGSLTRLDLDQDALGSWRLQRPMPIKVAMPQAAAGPLCLRNKAGSGGCLQFEQTDPGKWTASIDLDKLGFELIQGFLPETLVAEGGASLKGRFQAAGPVLTGNAVAEIPQGRLRMALGGGRSEDLDFSGTRLTLDSSAKALAVRLGLPLKGLGELNGNAGAPGLAPGRPGAPEPTTARRPECAGGRACPGRQPGAGSLGGHREYRCGPDPGRDPRRPRSAGAGERARVWGPRCR